jgi:hypothetical protein
MQYLRHVMYVLYIPHTLINSTENEVEGKAGSGIMGRRKENGNEIKP